MSKTSTSICWVLVDERDVAGDPLDHDSFEITDSSAAAPAATARRVRDIATASGYTVDSVHVTTSGNLTSVRDALTESGFGDVVPVSLAAATRAWATDAARANGHRKTAVCLFGRDSASLSLIDIDTGTTQSATTTICREGLSLIDWLKVSFGGSDFRPEALYLIGSRGKLDTFAGRLERVMSIPVIDTDDAQLALARGAVFSDATPADPLDAARRSRFAAHARTLTVVAGVSVIALCTLSAAGGPVPLASNAIAPPKPFTAEQPRAIAGAAAALVAPVALPPPPPPLPVKPPPVVDRWVAPEPADTVAPQAIPVTAAAEVEGPATTPVQHIPDAQPVQHIPESQPAAALGPAPTADTPPPVPPPPVNPLADVLSPLFSGLP